MLKNFFIFCLAFLYLQSAIAQNFQQQCLNAHNKYRKLHSAPNLVIDQSLTKVAQQWANNLAKNGKFEHRPNNKFGENLYASFGRSSINCGQAVKSWYDEIKFYDFSKPGFSGKTGHFTQVVWKSSRRVGCAKAQKGTSIYVVCNYDPPGNFLGRFPQNVTKK